MTENHIVETKDANPSVGVGVLVWREQKLLLGKRISRNKETCWQFPGGHLEPNETVIQCAQREVKEETGLPVLGLRHIGFTNQSFFVAGRKYITLYVSCESEVGLAQTLEPKKCETWQWFDYQNLPVPLFQPIEIFIAQLAESQQDNLYKLHCDSLSIETI